ncbi:MAG: hypothetical protein ACTSXP_00615, partial [Promethearchaeota archaeon]
RLAVIANKQDLENALPVEAVSQIMDGIKAYGMIANRPENRDKMITIVADILDMNAQISPLLRPLIERDRLVEEVEQALQDSDFIRARDLLLKISELCLELGDDLLAKEFYQRSEKINGILASMPPEELELYMRESSSNNTQSGDQTTVGQVTGATPTECIQPLETQQTQPPKPEIDGFNASGSITNTAAGLGSTQLPSTAPPPTSQEGIRSHSNNIHQLNQPQQAVNATDRSRVGMTTKASISIEDVSPTTNAVSDNLQSTRTRVKDESPGTLTDRDLKTPSLIKPALPKPAAPSPVPSMMAGSGKSRDTVPSGVDIQKPSGDNIQNSVNAQAVTASTGSPVASVPTSNISNVNGQSSLIEQGAADGIARTSTVVDYQQPGTGNVAAVVQESTDVSPEKKATTQACMSRDDQQTNVFQFICPVCKKLQSVKVPRAKLKMFRDKDLVTILTTPNCGHSSSIFLDKNLKVRGVQNADIILKSGNEPSEPGVEGVPTGVTEHMDSKEAGSQSAHKIVVELNKDEMISQIEARIKKIERYIIDLELKHLNGEIPEIEYKIRVSKLKGVRKKLIIKLEELI